MINPKHKDDIVEVCNIAVGYDDIIEEIVADSETTADAAGKPHTRYFERSVTFNLKDGFSVRYGGQTHRIPPGESRMFPWYIAEHYSKYLADFMLSKKEKETDRKGLINSPVERPAMLERILIRIVQPFAEDSPLSEGLQAIKVVDELNQGEKVIDSGIIPSKSIGKLTPEPPSKEEILANSPNEIEPVGDTSIIDPNKPLPTHKQLLEECMALDIPVRGNESKDSLVAKIKAFSR